MTVYSEEGRSSADAPPVLRPDHRSYRTLQGCQEAPSRQDRRPPECGQKRRSRAATAETAERSPPARAQPASVSRARRPAAGSPRAARRRHPAPETATAPSGPRVRRGSRRAAPARLTSGALQAARSARSAAPAPRSPRPGPPSRPRRQTLGFSPGAAGSGGWRKLTGRAPLSSADTRYGSCGPSLARPRESSRDFEEPSRDFGQPSGGGVRVRRVSDPGRGRLGRAERKRRCGRGRGLSGGRGGRAAGTAGWGGRDGPVPARL